MQAKANRKFTFFKGWHDFISELDTEAEQLEAYRTICDMAFQGEEGFKCPEMPLKGHLTPTQKVRRQIFHMVQSTLWKNAKDASSAQSEMALGRGRPRKGETRDEYIERTSARRISIAESVAMDRIVDGIMAEQNPPTVADEDPTKGMSEEDACQYRAQKAPPISLEDMPNATVSNLSKETQRRIARMKVSMWEDRIKNWEDLQKIIKDGYFGGDPRVAMSEDFCKYAYFQLVTVQHWRYYNTDKPIQNNLMNVIHGLVKNYIIMMDKEKGFANRRKIIVQKQMERTQQIEDEVADADEVNRIVREREIAAERRARELGFGI